MPGQAIDGEPEWAPGVSTVPFRNLSRAALVRTSARLNLGFDSVELVRIQRYYMRAGREPTDLELAGLAQSWSEHCSYKSSRVFLRAAFGKLQSARRVLGTGDAGVMKFEDGFAYALRIESHNHPSAVEPYGGAATGIGGILRDILAVGAKPIALADPLFFGPLDRAREQLPPGVKSPRYLFDGVVAGIRDYGNRVGVPTVTGGIYFDPQYVVNPLVNVGCVGFLPRARLLPNRARAAGDRLVLVGGLTGRDGIGGVSFASRELTERSETESRGAVQLGNPIMKEPLIHACIEAFDRTLVRGLKDLGGGGLATASGELVHAGGFGSEIDLDRVPLRERGLLPWEIWVSESQERMLLDVRPNDLSALLAIFRRWDVPATDIGRVNRGSIERIRLGGVAAGTLDVGFRVAPTPRRRPTRAPRSATRRPRARVPDELLAELIRDQTLAPDSVSREPVIRVYDHEVFGHTILKPLQGQVTSPSHGDAAVLRPRTESWKGLALTVAAQPWACQEDPRGGGRWVVEEAARNLYAVGARPDAFTNCLNFGNPEDPHVLGQFAAVVRGLAEGARGLDFAIPSGNVSFYNGGLGAEIPPTPVLLATGIVPDVRQCTSVDLKEAGNPLYLVGASRPELGGSLWARRNGLRGQPIPPTHPARLRHMGEALLSLARSHALRAVHDVSDGGLALTLLEMAFGSGLGFSVDLAATGLAGPGLAAVGEGASRWVVEVDRTLVPMFERQLRAEPVARLGEVIATGGHFRWTDRTVADLDLSELYTAWRDGLRWT
ncbi:MAG: phosphoribosylformylglycinamidine synthase subunit PurL [Thermoplasmata archaeon]|nr:phosphoribosylformylglycinamidine synthase subunit PurL [Thermoplasmata archaeon]